MEPKGFFRVKPADYFAWTYSMVAHGKYIDEQMGKVIIPALTKTEAADSTNLIISVIS